MCIRDRPLEAQHLVRCHAAAPRADPPSSAACARAGQAHALGVAVAEVELLAAVDVGEVGGRVGLSAPLLDVGKGLVQTCQLPKPRRILRILHQQGVDRVEQVVDVCA
eukprot:15122192-Alexandrium_andersonii.AAC.1